MRNPGIGETPSGMRVHIGFFGKTNSGKSTLVNALSSQDVSIVSSEPGTTTDPVHKAIEILPIGPCILIDTPGLEDETTLGSARMERTMREAAVCDIAVFVRAGSSDELSKTESELIEFFRIKNIPVVTITGDDRDDIEAVKASIIAAARSVPERTILDGAVAEGDLVMLVMPQDKQAPKGRLILPQVATLRELLDVHARTMCVAPEEMESALSVLRESPKLIITDSQVFDYVYERKPKESALTSFSVLFAALKGDIEAYVAGAKAIDALKPGARILIAESCSHAPLDEDIGRVKIPGLIKKRIGGDITVDVAAGKDFPEDLSGYDLILQCGGCMVNRRQILERIEKARKQGVPITNYGIAIAYIKGILEKVLDN